LSGNELDRRLRGFEQACRARGLKVTHQRTEVFRELVGTEEHPDAETVYQRVRKRVPSISRDTVYRTLAKLEREGLIRRAEAVTGPGRYDANTERHHHFICTSCGAIRDFTSRALDVLPLPRKLSNLGRVESAQVQVRGICAACARADAAGR
jgi:Fur family peroxide stress response transcriptional regulator